MKNNSLHTTLLYIAFFVFFVSFCILRLSPILVQSVPYTFDQGRDFLVVEKFVRELNPVFIGPTTGIEGVYHGVWWYYMLAIPYILTSGHPLGFYLLIFTLALVQYVLFFLFLKKEFGSLYALLFAGIVAISPYFVKISIFAVNSVLAVPFVLTFLVSLYYFLKTNRHSYLFFCGLSLGLLTEAELAFGLFLIPSFIFAIILLGHTRAFFGERQRLMRFVSGLLLAFLPRLLFELKNGFIQTQSLVNYIASPGEPHPLDVRGLIVDRIRIFSEFYEVLFPAGMETFGSILGALALIGIARGYRLYSKIQQVFLSFLFVIVAFLFLFSLFAKNSFFWLYYFEGFPYVYIMLVLFGAYGWVRSHAKYAHFAIAIIIAIFGAYSIYLSYPQLGRNQANMNGLRAHTYIVSKLYKNVGTGEWCARVYTPPVITYTYNYLFSYYATQSKGRYPHDTFIDGRCWYVIEPDEYGERKKEWLKNNIPKDAKMISREDVGDHAEIELWEIK